MPRVLLALLLLVASSAPARADTGLTDAVGAAWMPRYTDAALHAIAHERVVEITCEGCFNHTGMRPGTAEVIGYNGGYADPVAKVVADWQASSAHDAILRDRSFGRIGCAETVVGSRHYFVCVLGTGPLPPAPTPPSEPAGLLLPDTASAAP